MLKNSVQSTVLILASLLLGSCQTGENISLDEAKQVAAEFNRVKYSPPNRTINDILKIYGKIDDAECTPGQELGLSDTAKRLRHKFEQVPNWDPYKKGVDNKAGITYRASVNAYLKGNYRNAIKFLNWSIEGIELSPRFQSGQGGQGATANRLYDLAVFHAYAGDAQAAEDAIKRANALISSFDIWADPPAWAYKTETRLGLANGLGALMRGDLNEADSQLRRAIRYAIEGTEFANNKGRYRGRGGDLLVFGLSAVRGYAELAEVYRLRGQLLEAESSIRKALQLTRRFDGNGKIDILLFEAAILNRFAEILYSQKRYKDAEELSALVVKIYKSKCASIGLMAQAARETRAKSLLALGRNSEAENIFSSIEDALKDDPNVLRNRFGASLSWAVSVLLNGDARKSEKRLSAVLDRVRQQFGRDSVKEAEAIGFLGLAKLMQGERQTGMSNLAKAYVLFSNGQSEVMSNQWSRQIILKRYLKELLTDPGADSLNIAYQVAQSLHLGRVQRALSQNAARSKVGNEELAALIRQEQDLAKKEETLIHALNSLLGTWGNEKQKISNGIEKQLPKIRGARATLNREIANRFPRYNLLINPKPLTLAETKKLLKPQQALLVTGSIGNQTYIWSVPAKGSPKVKIAPISQNQLSQKVARIRAALDPGSIISIGDIPTFDVELAHQLYKEILSPVRDTWQDAQELLVVANGPLGTLPFSLLVTERRKISNDDSLLFSRYKKISWLAREIAITNLPSVSAVKDLGVSRSAVSRQERPFVGFGDPFFSAYQEKQANSRQLASRGMMLRSSPATRAVDSAEIDRLPRLADTRDEILAIASALKAIPKRDVFLGKSASEAQVKSMDLMPYKVISFATHGLVPGDLNGLSQPALALSSPKVTHSNEDGLLTMNEILGLKINADIAVLSACNTAAADGRGAEAISGLGRAFFYAGARSLLVSNWPVHSGATTELMTNLFQRQATNQNLSRAEALRQTRLHLIDRGTGKVGSKAAFSYAHPIFWAPFTLVGDGGSSKTGS